MYKNKHHLIIGFHGCDEETCNKLINSPNEFYFNKNPYDWLGHGMYFWEDNAERARQWAIEKWKQGKFNKPAVLGAIINPGHCCNFLDSKYTRMLGNYFQTFEKRSDELPKNRNVKSDPYHDKLLRELDCSVIEHMHREIQKTQLLEKQQYGFTLTPNYDTVRNAFLEGAPAFPGSEIKLKSHIQICVRNPNNILAYFRPRLELPSFNAA